MISPKFNFTPEGITLDQCTLVQGFDTEVQNAMLNLATDQGSDPLYPDRGTELQADGLGGSLLTTLDATHSANFAAIETTSFIQEQSVGLSIPETIAEIILSLISLAGSSLSMNIAITSSLGNQVGIALTTTNG